MSNATIPALSLSLLDTLRAFEQVARDALASCDQSAEFNCERAIVILRPLAANLGLLVQAHYRGFKAYAPSWQPEIRLLIIDNLLTALPLRGQMEHLAEIRAALLSTIDADTGDAIREQFKSSTIAEAQRTTAPRKGYRSEVKAWMLAQHIPNQEAAARTLGVSLDTLKSIMSNKGRPRYSERTLQAVLERIGSGTPK